MGDFSSTACSLNNGVRRDPRNEWIARNRLHPLHDSVMSARQGEVRGPSGLLRKNPHIIGFIGPNGIKRIDRANLSSTELNSKNVPARHKKHCCRCISSRIQMVTLWWWQIWRAVV